jgi:retron-type reverse transcriptase
MLLAAVYAPKFSDLSHGFRPGHSPHQALHALREQGRERNMPWIVDADVSGFFDELRHDLLREFIQRRVNEGGIRRLIGTWLKAGVMEEGKRTSAETGSPQGGGVRPILANVFLQYVWEEWYEQEVKPRLKGWSFLLRFAEDFLMSCALDSEAQRVMEGRPKRLGR